MSTALTPAEVRRIAALARLELTDEEVVVFATQLSAILQYAEQLQAVDTTGVAASAGMTTPTSIEALRDDGILPSLPREEALRPAAEADVAAGFFTVPRVLGS